MTAEQGTAKLVSIVAEAALEKMLCAHLDESGVGGYTVSDVRGRGRNGLRSGSWDASASIRIDVACSVQQSEELVRTVKMRFDAGYALFMFVVDAEVP